MSIVILSESAVVDKPMEHCDPVGKDLSFQRLTPPFECYTNNYCC